MVHAVAALSYVYLLLTGLAFWTPALYWIAVVLGGGFLSRAVHPWVGLVFAAVVVADVRDVAARHADDRRRSRVAQGDGRTTSATRTTACRPPDASTSGRSSCSG